MRTRTRVSDGAISDDSRYDYILAALPLPLFAGVTAGHLTGQPLPLTVGGGGLLSAAVLAYGLFVAGPTGGSASKRADAPIGGRDGRSRDATADPGRRSRGV